MTRKYKVSITRVYSEKTEIQVTLSYSKEALERKILPIDTDSTLNNFKMKNLVNPKLLSASYREMSSEYYSVLFHTSVR